MKKITSRSGKLTLKTETVKLLKSSELQDVAGGAPKTTRDLPCIPPPP